MASYFLRHPYVLLTLSGVLWGYAATCLVRRRSLRRRCSTRSLISIIFAVAVIIPAFGVPGSTVLLSRSLEAGLTIIVAGTVTMIFLLLPWWGELIGVILLAAVVVPPALLWNSNDTAVRSYVPEMELRITLLERNDPVIRPETREIALVRTSRGVSDVIHVSATAMDDELPHRIEYPDPPDAGFLGRWPHVATLPLDSVVDFSLEVMDAPPFLWWFPPVGTPVSFSVNGRTHFNRYQPTDYRDRLIDYFRTANIVHMREMHVSLPGDDARYIQPGTYVLEMAPRPQRPASADR